MKAKIKSHQMPEQFIDHSCGQSQRNGAKPTGFPPLGDHGPFQGAQLTTNMYSREQRHLACMMKLIISYILVTLVKIMVKLQTRIQLMMLCINSYSTDDALHKLVFNRLIISYILVNHILHFSYDALHKLEITQPSAVQVS